MPLSEVVRLAGDDVTVNPLCHDIVIMFHTPHGMLLHRWSLDVQ